LRLDFFFPDYLFIDNFKRTDKTGLFMSKLDKSITEPGKLGQTYPDLGT
jgi:hypothetical protein